jgi:hypothetical protein
MYRNGVRFALALTTGAAVLLAPAGSAAQEPAIGSQESQERLIALFSALSPDENVRIVTPVLFIDDGMFRGLRQEVVEVSMSGETFPVNLDDIRAISLRSGHGLKGAVWGVGAGLLVGSVGGMMVGSFDCNTPLGCNDSERQGALRGAVVIGLAGAITGFLVGRSDDYWKPVFP